MHNRNKTPSSTKSFTKHSLNEKQSNPQFHNIQFNHCVKQQINRLQKLINFQSQVRQISYKQLLKSIKHLQQTKKSKILIKNSNVNQLQRLFSPSRSKNCQSQSATQYKNLLKAFKTQIFAQLSQFNNKFNCIESQIKQIDSNIYLLSNNFINVQNKYKNQLSVIKQSLMSELKIIKSEIKQNGQIDKQMLKLKQQINFINQQHLQFKKQQNTIKTNDELVKKQICDCINKSQQKLNEKIILNVNNSSNQLKQLLSEGIKKHLENQHLWINKFTQQFQQKIAILDNCIQISQQTLKNLLEQTTQSFDFLQNKINISTESIISTKQSIEELFFGTNHKVREKLENINEKQCPQKFRQVSQTVDKINCIEKQIKEPEKRMNSLPLHQLTQPTHKQYQQ